MRPQRVQCGEQAWCPTQLAQPMRHAEVLTCKTREDCLGAVRTGSGEATAGEKGMGTEGGNSAAGRGAGAREVRLPLLSALVNLTTFQCLTRGCPPAVYLRYACRTVSYGGLRRWRQIAMMLEGRTETAVKVRAREAGCLRSGRGGGR